MHLAVGIFRVQEGLDYTGVIVEENQLTAQQMLVNMTKAKERDNPRQRLDSEGKLSDGKFYCQKFLKSNHSFGW